MGERTILSSFLSEEDAKRALAQVKQSGVETAQVDALHAFVGDEPQRDSFLISGKIPSLSSLTLHVTPDLMRDEGVLLAAHPAASGMSDGEGEITGRNYLLTVVCDDAQVEPTVNIIKACNGYT